VAGQARRAGLVWNLGESLIRLGSGPATMAHLASCPSMEMSLMIATTTYSTVLQSWVKTPLLQLTTVASMDVTFLVEGVVTCGHLPPSPLCRSLPSLLLGRPRPLTSCLAPPRAVVVERVMPPRGCFTVWALAAAWVVSLGGFLPPRLHLPSWILCVVAICLASCVVRFVVEGSISLFLLFVVLLLCFRVLTTFSVVLYPALYSPCFRPPSS
jgi:hypothetical protein